jgi:hypothetical protein
MHACILSKNSSASWPASDYHHRASAVFLRAMDRQFWASACKSSDDRSLSQQLQAIDIAGGVAVTAPTLFF